MTAMTALPAVFSDAMVRAILDGRKTHMRQPPKEQPAFSKGNLLWVKETFMLRTTAAGYRVHYRADGSSLILDPDCEGRIFDDNRWRASSRMPRWASRILLEVTGVHSERLQEITDEGILAEGIWGDEDAASDQALPVMCFASLWNSIHGPNSWGQNPRVRVVQFRRVDEGGSGSDG